MLPRFFSYSAGGPCSQREGLMPRPTLTCARPWQALRPTSVSTVERVLGTNVDVVRLTMDVSLVIKSKASALWLKRWWRDKEREGTVGGLIEPRSASQAVSLPGGCARQSGGSRDSSGPGCHHCGARCTFTAAVAAAEWRPESGRAPTRRGSGGQGRPRDPPSLPPTRVGTTSLVSFWEILAADSC